MNPVALDLGIIKIYWYSLAILTGMLIACILFWKQAKKHNINENIIINLLFYGIIFGIIGARLYYVLFNLSYYLKNPVEIIETWNGGLAIHGGIIAGAIWFIYYSIKNKINYLEVFDIAAPSIIIAQAIGRWGNFFNSEAHGLATTKAALQNLNIPNFVIKGMNINGVYYTPTFYYESLWDLIGFIILIIIRKYNKNAKPGLLIGTYLMWYSLGRFFIEGMRTDSLMFSNIRIAQLLSIVLFIIGLIVIVITNILKRRTKNGN